LVRWGGHTRLRERGWGSPNSDEGTHFVVLYVYKYFVPVCYYSLLLNIPDFKVAEIFLLDVREKATWDSFTVSTL
jgi:hypothetical protein